MTTTLREGELITASLRLVRPLASGGMGTVWVARHLGLKSDVAVKFVTGDGASDAEALGRFEREATVASEVRSPHVVQIFDHGRTAGGLPYIAMELLEGEDLATRVERLRVMPPGEVAGVVVQVARALARAHDKKVIHRDIKPENIFLCETGDHEAFVKVLDFGIAKLTTAPQLGGTATGAMLGTPYYMSPEQMVGSKATDHRTDLWSLGVVAFYALTGRRPFDADTLGGLAVEICGVDLPRASLFNPQLPPEIDAWLGKACARDPNARFPTARAMGEAMVLAVGGGSVAIVRSKSSAPGAVTDPDAAIALVPPVGLDATTPLSRLEPSVATNVAGPTPTLASGGSPSAVALASTTAGASSRRASITGERAPRSRVVAGAIGALTIGAVAFALHRGAKAPASTGAQPIQATASASHDEAASPARAPAAEARASASPPTPSAAPSVSGAPTPRVTSKPAIVLSPSAAPARTSVSAIASAPSKPPAARPHEEVLE